MTQTITATFENGVLKPAQPLDLPEHTQVRVTIEAIEMDAHRPEGRERRGRAGLGRLRHA